MGVTCVSVKMVQMCKQTQHVELYTVVVQHLTQRQFNEKTQDKQTGHRTLQRDSDCQCVVVGEEIASGSKMTRGSDPAVGEDEGYGARAVHISFQRRLDNYGPPSIAKPSWVSVLDKLFVFPLTPWERRKQRNSTAKSVHHE